MRSALTRGVLAVVGREQPRPPDAAALMSALPVAVVLLDRDNQFRYANHAAEQFLGMSLVQLKQYRLNDLLPPDSPLFLLVEQVRENEFDDQRP